MLGTTSSGEFKLVACEGKDCTAQIWWGEKFAGKHPFNPDGRSHFDTCPNAEDFREQKKKNPAPKQNTNGKLSHMSQKKISWLARLGDLDTEKSNRWCAKQKAFKHTKGINWDKVFLRPITETPCLKKFVQELEADGAPFENGVPYPDRHILACAIGQMDGTETDKVILGIIVKDWLYTRLYAGIYGTVSNEGANLRLSIANYTIKPVSEVPERMWDAYLETE